jgi:hypothetical protein
MLGPHRHGCADCQDEWDCLERAARATRCPVDVAAKVNRQGPFCHWCRVVRELLALAHLKGWVVEVRVQKEDGSWRTPPSGTSSSRSPG